MVMYRIHDIICWIYRNLSTQQPVIFSYSCHLVFSVDVTVKLIWQLLFPQHHNNLTDPHHKATHWLFVSFYFSGTERTTVIIIHHTIVRVEPDPKTAIQGGKQRLSDSPPTPIIDSSGMTQTPPMGGLLSPVTLPATRWPLLVQHKATGGATTQTRTTNVVPCTKKFKDACYGENSPQQLDWPWSPRLTWTTKQTVDGDRAMCLTNRL